MLRGTIIDAKDREKSWNIQENCRNEQMFAPLWFAVSRRASVRMKRGEPQSMRYMSAANANCNSRCNLQGTGIDHTKIRCPRQNISRNILWNTRGGIQLADLFFSSSTISHRCAITHRPWYFTYYTSRLILKFTWRRTKRRQVKRKKRL